MKPDIEAIRERVEKATAGPWTACCAEKHDGCSHVMHKDGMIADVTNGKWGDDYPSIRFVSAGGAGSMNPQIEAYMEQITFGEVPKEQATANKVFIAHARTDIPALLARVDELERVAEAASKYAEFTESFPDDDGTLAALRAALSAAGMGK